MNQASTKFKIYILALLAGLGFYQHTYATSGAVGSSLPSTEIQRSTAVGSQQPASWSFYAREQGQFRAQMTKANDFLLAAPLGYVAFMAEKKRWEVRETVTDFDTPLRNIEQSSIQAFEQTAQSHEEVVRRAAAVRQAAAAASMRRSAASSYSDDSYGSSSYSHK